MPRIRNQTRVISLASLIVCVITGLLLLPYFEVSKPLLSVSQIVLLIPFANIVRNIHFWSAQILLLSITLEIYNEYRAKRGIINSESKSILGLVITFVLVMMISMTGVLLRGDVFSKDVHQLTGTTLNFIPLIGSTMADFFTGKDDNVSLVYVHHITLAAILFFIKATERFRNWKINFLPVCIILLLIFAAGLFLNINLSDRSYQSIGININPLSINDSLRIPEKLPILGRNEGCIYCHRNVTGLTLSHNPDSIGCSSCHLGYPFSLDKQTAHDGMILIPGNLTGISNTCGSTNCHPDIASRVNGSLMNTMSGVVSVDRYVFGESNSLNVSSDIKSIGQSLSEKHIRNLCASCHLNKEKTVIGEVNESSRGGGCLACHLSYSTETKKEISENKGNLHIFHPGIDLKVTSEHCFGCHSRSGRISTNYEGWFETQLKPGDVKESENYRVLADERVFEKHQSDIHFEKGMQCIDCHLSYELMGDGGNYLHKEEQVKIQCIDCHSKTFSNTVSGHDLDFEARKIQKIKGVSFESLSFLKTSKSGYALTNAFFGKTGGNPVLLTKIGNELLPLKKPIDECLNGKAHKRLSCSSCHTQTVSQCVGCHTEYKSENSSYDLLDDKEVRGEWVESNSNIFNELPVLGIRTVSNSDGTARAEVITFAPGMVITIDKGNGTKIFKRLYAPVETHNIRREARSCISCHNNPVALGYGRGEFVFSRNGQAGDWTFKPALSSEQADGLPMDGWIGFLTEPASDNSTRTNTRPFSLEEQKRILTVGACLTCHKEESKVMKHTLVDFNSEISRMKKYCSKPF